MNTLLILSTEHGGQFYALFYILSFLTSISIISITAFRRNYPIVQTLSLIASGVFFFIVGTKIFGMSVSQWENIFNYQVPVITTRRTILGGLVGLTIGLGPYFQFDWRPIGFGLGVQVGKFWVYDSFTYNTGPIPGEYEYIPQITNFIPQTHLRVGPYDILYAEGRVSTIFPTGNLIPRFAAGLGTGLGRVDGSNLFAGYSEEGFILEGTLPIKEKYLLTGMLTNNFNSQPEEKLAFTLGFKYRFNFKTQLKRKAKDMPDFID